MKGIKTTKEIIRYWQRHVEAYKTSGLTREAYPRKENPRKASDAFLGAGISAEKLVEIIRWLELAGKSEQWQDKSKIPHPTTWLNQRRWEGDPPPMKKPIEPRDTVGQSRDRPPPAAVCECCEDTGRVLIITGNGRVVGRAPWSEARYKILAEPGEKTCVYRCACHAGRNYMNLEPEPLEEIA